MNNLSMPVADEIYYKAEDVVIFNQLARKLPMDGVSHKSFYDWLEDATASIGHSVRGAQIMEKPTARDAPPLNTAIYYDTPARDILPTGALLRTSCNKITHAFCAFKMAEDNGSVRKDHRYVFGGEEKAEIQRGPDGEAAVAVVRRLLSRRDIEHPGIFLKREYGLDPATLTPSIRLDSLRYGFFVWLDGRDALRCSIDRYDVQDLRSPLKQRMTLPVAEVELAVYPRISPEVAQDPRVIAIIEYLSESLKQRFGAGVTKDIKYQRSAQALEIAY